MAFWIYSSAGFHNEGSDFYKDMVKISQEEHGKKIAEEQEAQKLLELRKEAELAAREGKVRTATRSLVRQNIRIAAEEGHNNTEIALADVLTAIYSSDPESAELGLDSTNREKDIDVFGSVIRDLVKEGFAILPDAYDGFFIMWDYGRKNANEDPRY